MGALNLTSDGTIFNNPNMKLLKPPPTTLVSGMDLGTYTPRSTAPSLAKYNVPALLALLGIDKATDMAKQAYINKMQDLKIGRFADVVENPLLSAPSASAVPSYISPVVTSGDVDGDTLLTVLKGSSVNIGNVAEAVMSSNFQVAQSIEKVHAMLSTMNDMQIAYMDAMLNAQLDRNELLFNPSAVPLDEASLAYLDANYSTNVDILNGINNISIALSSLNLSELGVTIKRSVNEVSLTDKKLEHITYEMTPVQMNNIEDDIPSMSPQAMRALKDAVVAKKNSDENTFEVKDDDIDDMFGGGFPDISEIFSFSKKTERLPTFSS